MQEQTLRSPSAASPYTAYMETIHSPEVLRADRRQLVSSIVTHPEMNMDEKMELLVAVARATDLIETHRAKADKAA